MRALDPAIPVPTTSFCLDINGEKTNVIISSYQEHILVVATQIGSMGTILQARYHFIYCSSLYKGKEGGGVSVDPTFSVTVLLGKRDEPMLFACARQLIEHISNSGSSKSLVLTLGLRDHSSGTLKTIVSAVTEKLPEVL